MGVDTTLQLFDQEAYDRRLFPACAVFVHGKDPEPLRRLLKEVVGEVEARPPTPRSWRQEVDFRKEFKAALAMLGGRGGGRRAGAAMDGDALRAHVLGHVIPLLVDAVCLLRRRGAVQELNLWEADLAAYLFDRSDWIREHFEGFQPPTDANFEFSTCAATSATPPWFADRFLKELERVPRPEPFDRWMRAEYDLLIGMLRAVQKRPALRLVVEAC
jgi:hypothetical protein